MAFLLSAGSSALGQARVAGTVKWVGEKPREVEFQSASGNSEFADRSTHYYGEKTFEDSVYRQLDVVVRYADGTNAPFNLRSEVNSPSFNFTVRKPAARLACNLSDVEALEPTGQSSDQNELVATMQTARAMLSVTAAPCPGFLAKRVAKIWFTASCNLAKQTHFFDVSQDAVSRLLREYRDSRLLGDIRGQIDSCRKQVRGQVLAAANGALRGAIRDRNFSRFGQIDEGLAALLSEKEWQEAMPVVHLPEGHFEDLRVEAAAIEARLEAAAMQETAESARPLDN